MIVLRKKILEIIRKINNGKKLVRNNLKSIAIFLVQEGSLIKKRQKKIKIMMSKIKFSFHGNQMLYKNEKNDRFF